LAVKNGGVYAWGANNYGQLGNGTTTNHSSPVAVSGLSTGASAIAAGMYFSLAVQDGGVYAWGYNGGGQLGDGTTTNHPYPVAIGALSSGVTTIAAGVGHSLALRNGGVYAWGWNGDGQLGGGSTTNTVSGLSTGVTAIAAGGYFSLAVQNGGAYAWGDNMYGQVGDGTHADARYLPVAVSGLSNGVTAIAAGANHSLAVRNGGVYAWGNNDNGELGDGTTSDVWTPERIDPNDLNNIVAVAAGFASSYALSADGTLWVWGDNSYGELGLGTLVPRPRNRGRIIGDGMSGPRPILHVTGRRSFPCKGEGPL
jgi:alpha-tubulin suppressor-like RCC1 family protein